MMKMLGFKKCISGTAAACCIFLAENAAWAQWTAQQEESVTVQEITQDGNIVFSNEVKIEMVKVKQGWFTMGQRDGENEKDEVEHTATLSQDFYIGKTEITQAQWKAVMGNNPSDFQGDELPVEKVSWHDAMTFCKKLNVLTKGMRPDGYRYTLPTETQWEYAFRGGHRNSGYKYCGSYKINEVAWYDGNSRRKTHEVGAKKGNELGLHDMSGNVWEWCLDDCKPDRRHIVAEFTRGNDKSPALRVLRGGSWLFNAGCCRAASWNKYSPNDKAGDLGFRLALSFVGKEDKVYDTVQSADPAGNKTEKQGKVHNPSSTDGDGGEVKKSRTPQKNRKYLIAHLPHGVILKMVKVEKGEFIMSKKDGENYSNREIAHKVSVSKDFYIGQTEVTQWQWQAIMENNPSAFKGDDLPVESISWQEATAFCEKLNDLTADTRPAGYKYALPAEIQWEYACRGGRKGKGTKYSGSNNCNDVAWYNNGGRHTHPVGQKIPNELGLYDMSGNVWEMCSDQWTGVRWKPPVTGAVYTNRGGGWKHVPVDCRSANRNYDAPDFRANDMGFRLALVPEEK